MIKIIMGELMAGMLLPDVLHDQVLVNAHLSKWNGRESGVLNKVIACKKDHKQGKNTQKWQLTNSPTARTRLLSCLYP